MKGVESKVEGEGWRDDRVGEGRVWEGMEGNARRGEGLKGLGRNCNN